MRNFNITVNGQSYSVSVDELGAAPAVPTAVPVATPAAPAAPAAAPVAAVPAAAPAAIPGGGTKVTAPIPGNVNDVLVKVGDAVKVGDRLIVLESMKMENDILAPVDGTVTAVAVAKGDVVSTDALFVVIG